MGILTENYRIVRGEPSLATIEYTSFNETVLGTVDFDKTLRLEEENLRWLGEAITACLARDETFVLKRQSGSDSLEVSESGYEYGAHVVVHNTRENTDAQPGKSWVSMSGELARKLANELLA